MQPHKLRRGCVAALLGTTLIVPATVLAQQTTDEAIELAPIVITAEEQARQALGASTITAEDLEKLPVANDLSEIVRKMPGVNLTGNSTSGQRGNNRQIDIRGMGPENTLILIDGKPVLSRNSVKMGRAGERDTRGDSNWVPPELVERIEVLRGPAAARYGSGASGGVVNIITKRPDVFTGQVGLSFHLPESSDEGDGKRTNFMLAGPISERLSFRLTGNYNKTDGDAPEINKDAAESDTAPSGREGVVNKDLTGLLTFAPRDGHEIDFEAGFSRQGNIYAGDRGTGASGGVGSPTDDLAQDGAETNTLYRRTLGITHRGEYGFGDSFSYLQWERTRNHRLGEGPGGRNEGAIDPDLPATTTDLDNITAKTEWTLPLTLGGRDQALTLGAEVRHERMEDQSTLTLDGGTPSKLDQTNIGIYAENNIQWDDRLTLTPALRMDWADTFGFNASPSLNATYAFTDEWSMKVGVARAFKAPNLYQLNPNYRYSSMGNGCQRLDDGLGTNQCYIYGNPDLKPETSLNTEVGIAYEGAGGIDGSLTYFHNDYKDRITAGDTFLGYENGYRVFSWDNTPEAKVSGLEGSFATPLGESFALSVNATYMIKSEDHLGRPLSLVPNYTINSALDWYARDDLTVTLSMTNYGRTEARQINNNTGEPADSVEDRPSYTLVNLGAKWDVTETAHLSTGVTNLFDEQLFRTGNGANTYNEPGRAFYLSISKTF
ncbi:FepA family TonB-dependent siderophore receptor [Cereibacter sp. SYSU M97828]|nr:FepA family TonB-dependent siderophore receptor [Cereibacter flavus]